MSPRFRGGPGSAAIGRRREPELRGDDLREDRLDGLGVCMLKAIILLKRITLL
jgi:hypothetical protein